jgi:hypothetical protein
MPSIHDFLYGDEKGLPWLEAHEVSETGFGEPGDPLSPSSDRFRASARTSSSNPGIGNLLVQARHGLYALLAVS